MFLPLITYFINLLTILLSLCSYNQRFKDKTKQLLYFLLIIPTLSTCMPNSKKNSDLRISIQVTIFSILEFF